MAVYGGDKMGALIVFGLLMVVGYVVGCELLERMVSKRDRDNWGRR